MAKYSGKTGKLHIGAQEIFITEWEYDDRCGTPDATDSESGNGTARVVGRKDGELTFSGYYDSTSTPTEILAGTEGDFTLLAMTGKTIAFTGIISQIRSRVDVAGGTTVGYSGTAVMSDGEDPTVAM